MNLSKNVCSFELAERLKELNVMHEGSFFWIRRKRDDALPIITLDIPFFIYVDHENIQYKTSILEMDTWQICVAPTASELLAITPQYIFTDKNEPFNTFRFSMDMRRICKDNTLESLTRFYCIDYVCDAVESTGEHAFLPDKLFDHCIRDENPANALAKNIIRLVENNFLKS